MKQIEPYLNINDAILSLDNGGRFYNILTHAEDGKISPSEIGKVGGIFNEKQKMMLFLELSISKLDEKSKENVIAKLDGNLQLSYQKYKSNELLPSEAHKKGIISSNAILTGVPKMIESRSDFNGFIMVPIVTGKVISMIMIPIFDQYDVYELRDEIFSDSFLIAHAKGSKQLPGKKIKVAGVLKELKLKKDEENSSKKFLEVNYFLDLD